MVTHDNTKNSKGHQFMDGLEDELNDRAERLYDYKTFAQNEKAQLYRHTIQPMLEALREAREWFDKEYVREE